MKQADAALMQLVQQVRALAPGEGCTQTDVPWLRIHRCTAGKVEMPQLDTPYLYLVLDGAVRLYTPSGILDYIAGQYSVSEIDTPLAGHILAFSGQADFLALSLAFTANDVISVVLELEGDATERISDGRIAETDKAAADRNVTNAVSRLVGLLGQPLQLAYMAKHIRREIIFSVLCGSCGQQFLQSIVRIQQAGEIYEVNSWIKQNFRNSFTVEELAEKRNMSVSQFHQKFKNAVGMGPLQCQKRLRLTEARRLMLDENKNVTEAALEVGYESASQFTRDYRKMFGLPPKEDIASLRGGLEKQADFS